MGLFNDLEKLVELEELKKLFAQESPHAILRQWTDAAGEIEPSKRPETEKSRKGDRFIFRLKCESKVA